MTPALVLAALLVQGVGPGRHFAVVQRSYWISDGIDPTAPSPADTALLFVPDSEVSTSGYVLRLRPRDWGPAVDFARDSNGGVRAILRITDSTVDALAAQAYGTLPTTLAAWMTLPSGGGDSAWGDTLEYHHAVAGDTAVFRWTRALRRLGVLRTELATWLRLAVSTRLDVTLRGTIDRELDPAGVRMHAALTGPIDAELLYSPATGQIDSLHVRGTLLGMQVFERPDGRTDTIQGRWVVRQDACWFTPPDSAHAIWVGEAGYVDAYCPLPGSRPSAYWPLAARAARGDTAALDSLFLLRRREADPFARVPVDLLDPRDRDARPFVRRAIAAYRPGDEGYLRTIAWEGKLAALRAWFATRRIDPVSAFRKRFAAEADTISRWPGFPGDILASEAFGLLWRYRDIAADTIRDPVTLTKAQVHVLQCERALPSDSSPPLLLGESVTPDARDQCGQRYRVVTHAALQQRADSAGRTLGVVVSPLLRIGHRYVIDVTGHSWTRRNEFCLCGHGDRYLLTHRNGQWYSVLISSWVN